MRIVLVVVLVLVAIGVIAQWLGSRLPREHRAAVRVTIPATPVAVFAAISDHAAQPAWRRGLASVESLPPVDGHPRVREHGGDALALVVETSEAPTRYVTRIEETPGAPFGGRWRFELSPAGDGTVVTITEDGWIGPALFRLLGAYVFGLHTNLERYATDLATHFGATPVIERR